MRGLSRYLMEEAEMVDDGWSGGVGLQERCHLGRQQEEDELHGLRLKACFIIEVVLVGLAGTGKLSLTCSGPTLTSVMWRGRPLKSMNPTGSPVATTEQAIKPGPAATIAPQVLGTSLETETCMSSTLD